MDPNLARATDSLAQAAANTSAQDLPDAAVCAQQGQHSQHQAVHATSPQTVQQQSQHRMQHEVLSHAARRQTNSAAHQRQAERHHMATHTEAWQGRAVVHQKQPDVLRKAHQVAAQPPKAAQPPSQHRQHKSGHSPGSQTGVKQARRGPPSNASSPGGSSPTTAVGTARSSPGSSQEHSSVSLSQLAVASRSKLKQPTSQIRLSPPKRSIRAAGHKQATHNHLASLAATVPLPASPVNDAKEAPAVAALAMAVAKPSHVPAPVAKPSRLKKPTNTSGFFSSGRSFTGGQRCAYKQ